MKNVVIADYGSSNLLSVVRAFNHVGARVSTATEADEILQADILVLPGVGAFENCINGLKERGLDSAVSAYVSSDRMFLGICVGMQMMFERSTEFGDHRGLGIVAGSVEPIPATGGNGKPHKIPHIGWNKLIAPAGVELSHTILRNLPDEPYVYFVHSFAGNVLDPDNIIANTDYNGRSIAAVLRSGNAYGCQFHPEKSGEIGLQILQNFLEGSS